MGNMKLIFLFVIFSNKKIIEIIEILLHFNNFPYENYSSNSFELS